jgi:hypothetical protein
MIQYLTQGSWQGLLDTTLCDKVCQRLVTERWLSLGTPVYSTNKNDCHDITEILLKVAFDTTSLTLYLTEYLTENMMYDMFRCRLDMSSAHVLGRSVLFRALYCFHVMLEYKT